MKKFIKLIFIFSSLIFLFTSCFKTEEEKMQESVDKVLTHLKKRYGEEFYISSPFGGRPTNDDELRVMVKPVRYLGTAKEDDEYYEDYAYLEKNGETGDGFGTVYLKESAEKFFKPKLEELFGKNVLVAVYPDGHYKKIDFKEEMRRRKELYKDDPEGEYYPLTGGIYIFGRVENEKDREKYREGIYEFIQYLKQEGMFEYVEMVIKIYDERCLTPSYEEVAEKLKEERKIQKNSTDYKKVREKLLTALTKEYSQMTEKEKQEKLSNIIKSDMIGEKGWYNDYSYSQIYHYAIYSPKSIKTNYFLQDIKPLEYKNPKEIKLLDTFKIDYKEYDKKALRNNEWGD